MPAGSEKRLVASPAWQLEEVRVGGKRRSAASSDPLIDRLAQPGRLEVQQSFQASARARRTAEALPPLEITAPAEPRAAYILALRHPSGALSFHLPEEAPKRRGARPGPVRFRVEFPVDEDDDAAAARRSILTSAVKGIVLKVTGKVVDMVLPKVAALWEKSKWKSKDLPQGWLQVTAEGLRTGKLPPASFDLIRTPDERNLLLLHGTFSNTAGAFQELAHTLGAGGQDFFSAIQPLYGNRIFGFNHFTVSKPPEQNARELVQALPKPATFDVITHSRGGLVLRNLAERGGHLGSNADRFRLGRAVLVASPNQGTPLASAEVWDKYVGWIANLVELFPENPLTLTIEFISEAITWLAHRLKGGLPGLESMDVSGDMIRQLQAPPGPPPGSYSALVSNFEPTRNLALRMADVGVDAFFRMANDLVVPSEGGWRVDDPATLIPGNQIGCFGRGGNLAISNGESVYHNNYFSQPETVDFLIRALTGQPHPIPALNPAANLPFRGRRAVAAAAAPAALPPPAAPEPRPTVPVRAVPSRLATRAGIEADDVFHLFLISADEHLPKGMGPSGEDRTALLLATYRNARVVETIYIRGQEAALQPPAPGDEGEIRWRRIMDKSDEIRDYINGRPDAPDLPDRANLQYFGVELFRALLWGNVRRLYDTARAEAGRCGRRLDVVVTSMINWIADRPWEFAYDPNRQTFLATEDVNFTRNVLTAVPCDEIPVRKPPMRILVVVAQPVSLAQLSAKEEETVIHRGFQNLEQAGLAQVEVLLSATPEKLHQRLQYFADEYDRSDQFDIVHFIGHGEYREAEREGYLIFEDERGGEHAVSAECMRQIVCHRGIRLIFLNACETGMVGGASERFDFNRGLAPKIVAGGIPVVVANQYKVLDSSATEFAQRFYWSLAQGSTVGDAAREARVAVNYSIAGECIDWAVPVVYARNPAHRLFEPAETHPIMPSAHPRAGVRRGLGEGVLRIGLWDVNHALPHLEEIAGQLNDGQDYYRFQVVEISAPIGTWRLVPRKDGKGSGGDKPQGVIIGREVSEKLRDQVTTLGLDRLFCLTTFAVADEIGHEYFKDLTLWNNDPKQRVAIVSVRLLGVLEEHGYPIGRFMANAIASALCGVLEHRRRPVNCPNFFRKEHASLEARLEYVAGQQKFCAQCRRKLAPDVRIALDRVLAAY